MYIITANTIWYQKIPKEVSNVYGSNISKDAVIRNEEFTRYYHQAAKGKQ
jgi:hypothetical protein